MVQLQKKIEVINFMFLHIGGDLVVRSKDIIAILDINNTDENIEKSRYFNKGVEKETEVVKIANESIKSIILTKEKVFYSPISSLTLKKRSDGSY